MAEVIVDQDPTYINPNPVVEEVGKRDPLWLMAAEIEASVFIEKGYVDTAAELESEYEPYLPGTEFLVASIKGATVGSVRCIRKTNQNGFKTFSDLESGRLVASESGQELINLADEDKILEIGTLAVAPEYRSQDDGRIAVHLYGAILGYMNNAELTTIIASFDERYFNSFKDIFGATVQQVGPAIEYMGSKTIPAIMDVHEMFEHLRVEIPEIYNTVLEASHHLKITKN